MKLTLPEAAKMYKKHRSTLHRHIESGRLSCEFRGDGTRVIDLSELIRCYGEPVGPAPEMQPDATTSPSPPPPDATGFATTATGMQPLQPDATEALLQALQALQEEMARLREEVAQLRALPAPSPPPATDATVQPEPVAEPVAPVAGADDDPHGLRSLLGGLRKGT